MAFLLLLPFFLIRFALLSQLDRKAVQRAAHFAPLPGRERIAYWLYQLATAALILGPFFCRVKCRPVWLFAVGLAVYLTGVILLTAAVINFAAPDASGVNQNGLYRLSRNPMYVAYFIFFMGCVLLTQSRILLAFVLLFQITAHRIILAEERWCIRTFGDAYRQYMARVSRYL